MINTVAEALNIRTEDDLRHALLELDHDIEQEISLLTNTLAKNPVSSDVSSIFNHMGFVESWRSRIGRFHMVVSALVAHAKSDEFEIVPAPGIKITEVKREMHIKRLSGGFSAWQVRLENLLDDIDSRVNLCKKILGVEEAAMPNRKFSGGYVAERAQ